MSRFWSAQVQLPSWLRARIAIDPRALAAFRIALAVVLGLDVVMRLRHFRALYTDAGAVPRSAVLPEYGSAYELLFSLPDPWYPAVSFVVLALAAFALLVGWRSRLAALCSLLALVTIQMRNPFVLNGGDVLLRVLVLWAVVLPLDRRWALGSSAAEAEQAVSVATVGVLVQVVLVYVVNATHKLESEAWRSGEAVAGVFRTEQYTYLLADLVGDVLLGTGLLTAITYAWFALLLVSPLLVLSTGRRRSGLVSVFVAAHVGMFCTLSVGLFPLVSITSLLLLYPPGAWDRAEAWLAPASARLGASRLRARARRVRGRAERVRGRFSGAGVRPAIPPRLRQGGRTVVLTVLPAAILVVSLVSAAGVAGVVDTPAAAARTAETADVGQDWGMFAPNPPDTTWWIATPATRADGTTVDALHDDAIDSTASTHAARLPSFRWRKYYQRLQQADAAPQRSAFAHYLCANRDVDTVDLYYGYERVDSDGSIERGGETLLVHDCEESTTQE